MAKKVNIDYTGKFNLPIPIGRLNPTPADSTEIWKTLADAQNYAATGPTAYVGQIIYVQEKQQHYYISDEAGTLAEIKGGALDTIVRGYKMGNEFYTDSTYTEKLTHDNQKFYVDLNGGNYSVYAYHGDGVGYKLAANVPDATSQIKGIVKLYNTVQDIEAAKTDGAITASAVKTAIDSIKLDVTVDDEECLCLAKPW